MNGLSTIRHVQALYLSLMGIQLQEDELRDAVILVFANKQDLML